MKSLLAILVLFSFSHLAGQDLLSQKWHKKQSTSCENSGEPLKIMEAPEIWDFSNVNEVTFKTYHSNGDVSERDFIFRKEENKIINEFWTYEIITHTKDELILKDGTDMTCQEIRFVSEKIIHDEQLTKFALNGTDTLYLPLPGMGPRLEDLCCIHSYLKTEMTKKYLKDGVDCKFSYQFTVGKDGGLSIRKVKGCDEKAEKRLTKLIEKTTGTWTPMKIHGKPVEAFLQSKFRVKTSVLKF